MDRTCGDLILPASRENLGSNCTDLVESAVLSNVLDNDVGELLLRDIWVGVKDPLSFFLGSDSRDYLEAAALVSLTIINIFQQS